MLMNNTQIAFSIGRIFLGIGMYKIAYDTIPCLMNGFSTYYPRQKYSKLEYNYYYYKHLSPNLVLSCVLE
jgi:hypothetical protein